MKCLMPRNIFSRFFKKKIQAQDSDFSRQERSVLDGMSYLGDRPVETFMAHRSEITWLEAGADAGEVQETLKAHPEQRFFPVAGGALDNIKGVVSDRKILESLLDSKPWPGLRAICSRPHFIPQSMSALKAFDVFHRENTDYLCVIDEYGGFSGVLPIRNLLEELVGELVRSESASELAPGSQEEEIVYQDDGTVLSDGSVNIDELAESLEAQGMMSGFADALGEHPAYHTLAGFILDIAGEIPRTGASFDYRVRLEAPAWRFKIVDMDGNRIDKVLISRL
jgi:putative hemolysin